MNIYGKKLSCRVDRIKIKDKRKEIDVLMIIGFNKNGKIVKIIFAYADDDIAYMPKSIEKCFIVKKINHWDLVYTDKNDFNVTIQAIDRLSNYIINNMLIHLYKKLGKRAYIKLLNLSGKIIINE